MERITGATTVFLHTPGTKPARGRRSDEVQVEVYASPHTRMTNEEDIAMLAQSFADKIARLHLMSFLQHCKNSAIAPPNKKCTFMSWFMFQIIHITNYFSFWYATSKEPLPSTSPAERHSRLCPLQVSPYETGDLTMPHRGNIIPYYNQRRRFLTRFG